MAGNERGNFNTGTSKSSSAEASRINPPERRAGTFHITTVENAERRITRTEAVKTGIEALTAQTKITDVKRQALEILNAVYTTSKAIDTVVDTTTRVIKTMLLKNASITMGAVEDTGGVSELPGEDSSRRTPFSLRYSHQEAKDPFAQELEAVPSRLIAELEAPARAELEAPLVWELEAVPSRSIAELEAPLKAELEAVPVSSIVELEAKVNKAFSFLSVSKDKETDKSKKAEGVARKGLDVARKAREAEKIAEGAENVAEEAEANAKKIYKSSRQSIKVEAKKIMQMPGQEKGGGEALSMEEVKSSLLRAEEAVATSEDVAVATVFSAIDSLTEAAALMGQEEREAVLSMEAAKEVVAEVAAELFTKAEVRSQAVITAAAEEKEKIKSDLIKEREALGDVKGEEKSGEEGSKAEKKESEEEKTEKTALKCKLQYIFLGKTINTLKSDKMSVEDARKNAKDFLEVSFTTPEQTYADIMDFTSTHELFSELRDYMKTDRKGRNEEAKINKMKEYLDKIMALTF